MGPACRDQRRGHHLQRRGELDQRDIRGDTVAHGSIDVKVRMVRDSRQVLERGLPRVVKFNQLVIGARLDAMCCSEHDIACERDAGAEGAA